MAREEVLGRSAKDAKALGKAGCGYLGKLVSYPGGRYEEVGKVWLDISSPHCMLVLGKRGTGKSYTLGVLAEMFATLEEDCRENISVIVIDTMSVFHSLKSPNTNQPERKLLKKFGLRPKGFKEEVKIFLPKISVEQSQQNGRDLYSDFPLTLRLSDVDVYDWLHVFNLKATEPAGILLIKIMQELRDKPGFGFKDIYHAIEDSNADNGAKEAVGNLFSGMEGLKIFSKKGTPHDLLVKGGQISVLDLSYLGRLGGFDLRNLIVSVLGRQLMSKRTLQTTFEMQYQAKLVKGNNTFIEDEPLVYMVLDEAHLFLPSNTTTLATETLIDWIKLGRHPGLSVIMATQEPSALHESAIRQSDIILAHNVTSSDDIQALGKAKQSYMKGGKNIQEIVAEMEYRRGLAVLFDDKTQTVELVKVRPRHSLHAGMDATAL